VNPNLKEVIYYTDNLLGDPIYSLVQKHILASGLTIVSASLEPITFGYNETIEEERSYPTMVKQIISCLERSPAKYVFFCETDVLYPKSHFDFTPPRDDIFYYNENTWRWLFGSDTAISHDRMLNLSNLCANRDLVLDHYRMRDRVIKEKGWNKLTKGDPKWIRKMGYEPGTKKKKRGGLTDDDFSTWKSELPTIDIRHKKNFSPAKLKLSDFTHEPKWWKEVPIEEVPGWDLKGMFNL